eukprot:920217-Rhodomonas_salina.1
MSHSKAKVLDGERQGGVKARYQRVREGEFVDLLVHSEVECLQGQGLERGERRKGVSGSGKEPRGGYSVLSGKGDQIVCE